MKMKNLPLFVKPPSGFYPGSLYLNYLLAYAALETWIDNRIRHSKGWKKYFYPSPWHKTFGSTNDKIFKAAQYLAIILPLIVGATSALPIIIKISSFELSIAKNPDFTTSFKISFVSAIFFIFSLIIRTVFAPPFIAEHPRKFISLPEAMTKEELHTSYIAFCTKGMPKAIKYKDISFTRDSTGSYNLYYTIVVETPYGNRMSFPGADVWGMFSYLCWRCSSPDQWSATIKSPDFFDYKPNFFQGANPLLDKITLDGLSVTGHKIYEIDSMGLEGVLGKFVYSEKISAMYRVLFGCTSLIEGKETACYQYLYGLWDYASPIARAAFWCCYRIAFVLGLFVTLNLLVRGFKIIF